MSILDRNPALRRTLKFRISVLLPEADEQINCEDIERMALEDGITTREDDLQRFYDYLTYMNDETLRKKLLKILERRKKKIAGVC